MVVSGREKLRMKRFQLGPGPDSRYSCVGFLEIARTEAHNWKTYGVQEVLQECWIQAPPLPLPQVHCLLCGTWDRKPIGKPSLFRTLGDPAFGTEPKATVDYMKTTESALQLLHSQKEGPQRGKEKR